MRNQITFNRNYTSLTEEMVDEALGLVEGIEIYISGVSSRKTGYGHWEIGVDVYINNGERITLKMVTTDSVSIDNWNNEDSIEGPLGEDVQAGFIVSTISENESRILDLIAE